MESKRLSLLDLLAWDDRARFIIPKWQRQFVWGSTGAHDYEIKQLWDDISSSCNQNNKHFCGVMLLQPVPDPTIKSWEIVDGQQRMTAFFLLFIAVRDECEQRQIDFSELSHVFTTEQSDQCRLVLQQGLNNDREVMNALLKRSYVPPKGKDEVESLIASAYQYFRTKLGTFSDQAIMALVLDVLQGVDLITLIVTPTDNTRRIFETLNNRGRRIDPYDLVSNLVRYIGQQDEELNAHAQQVWYHITRTFEKDDLEDFLSAFAKRNAQQTARGTTLDEIEYEVRSAQIAGSSKQWLDEFGRASGYYNQILFPDDGHDPIQVLLQEIRRLRVPKINPFLLALLETFGDTPVSEPLIQNIRSLVVRILISYDRPAYRIEKFAEQACEIFYDEKTSKTDRLKEVAALIDKEWIGDEAFKKALLQKPIYGPGAHLSRLRYYLEKIEQLTSEASGQPFEVSFGRKTTVEHIMPQTLTQTWKNALRTHDAVRLDLQHQALVDTIGNLTVLLVADNSSVKNASFADKKEFYLTPNETMQKLGIRKKKAVVATCALNGYFEQISSWNFQEITKRGHHLAELALQIWKKENVPGQDL